MLGAGEGEGVSQRLEMGGVMLRRTTLRGGGEERTRQGGPGGGCCLESGECVLRDEPETGTRITRTGLDDARGGSDPS